MNTVMIDLGKHFVIQEFVPESIYQDYGRNAIWFLDPKTVNLAGLLRKRYGKMTINNWLWGGDLDERGFRLPNTETGSEYSQHKLGRALDFNIEGISPNEVRVDLLANQELFMACGLTTIEHEDYAPSWVHVDCRPTNRNEILIVTP